MSQRLAVIPCGVHQTPVPRSSDRRSYYFLIALVAYVPWETPHHVTDSSVNTALGWLSESSLQRHQRPASLPPPLPLSLSPDFSSLCVYLSWPGPPSASPLTSSHYPHLTLRVRSHLCWGEFIANLAAPFPPADQETTPTPKQPYTFVIYDIQHIFNIFRCTLLVPLMRYHNNMAQIAWAGAAPLCMCQ